MPQQKRLYPLLPVWPDYQFGELPIWTADDHSHRAKYAVHSEPSGERFASALTCCRRTEFVPSLQR